MKINSNISPVGTINSLISAITEKDKNRISGIYLDESLTEFFSLNNEIIIPPISVKELVYESGIEITKKLIDSIPEYLHKHKLLENRRPSSEQHSLHFIRMIPGNLLDFVHILRLDFKATGAYGRLAGKGDNRTFPEYTTDRVRFRSRLVPVIKGSDPSIMENLRIRSSLEMDTDGKRFTSVFFDQFSTTEISIELSSKCGSGIFSIPPKIYQFISYDYFTACLNIPDPSFEKLDEAAELFEPLFIYLFFQYNEGNQQIKINDRPEFNHYLDISGSSVTMNSVLTEKLKEFFSHYTLYRDDDMLLKGLRRIDITK